MICLSCLYDPRYPDPVWKGLPPVRVFLRLQSKAQAKGENPTTREIVERWRASDALD